MNLDPGIIFIVKVVRDLEVVLIFLHANLIFQLTYQRIFSHRCFPSRYLHVLDHVHD